ncbi:MAG: hypothetical protein J5897_04620 [Candidatus Methanomethylophilus sp.]|nr:hypothetical protein [Methanomethylophilus sp.]
MTLFRLGTVVTTQGIRNRIENQLGFAAFVESALTRHSSGDWGDLSEDDREMNDAAIEAEQKGEPTDQLFSAYECGTDKIWIITEYDRSVTTVLLPEEY